jgi:hypothetical protein
MNDKIQELMEEPWFIPTVVGVAASIGGFIAGGIVGLRVGYAARVKEEEKFEEIITEVEVESQLEFDFDTAVAELVKTDPDIEAFIVEETVVEETWRNDPNPRNDPADIVVTEPGKVIYVDDIKNNNVFDTSFDHWDYEDEVPLREGQDIYVIHRDEFWGEELNFDQSSLTYYAGDDILVDQEDQPIYSYASVTGPLLFGHGSGDRDVVYIRNHKQSAEYEVQRFDSSYTLEVLGVTAEEDSERSDLKHSVRKFRPRDD